MEELYTSELDSKESIQKRIRMYFRNEHQTRSNTELDVTNYTSREIDGEKEK